jgi:phosphoglycerol transferase
MLTRKIKTYLKLLFYFLSFALLGLLYWLHHNFGEVDLQQVIATLQFGVNETLTADSVLIKGLIKYCLFFPLILVLIIYIIEKVVVTKHQSASLSARKSNYQIDIILAGINNLFRLKIKTLNFLFKHNFFIFLFFAVVFYTAYSLSAWQCAKEYFGDSKSNADFFKENYVDPKKIKFTASNPKSLVFIQLESMEDTYTKKEIFGKDLLHQLTALQRKYISFNKYHQLPGTNLTVSGFVATQCGIPFKTVMLVGVNQQGELADGFLPNATCLSDILAKQGYKNIIMLGSSIKFSGLDKFAKYHHYHEIYGKDELIAKGDQSIKVNYWGLYDDELFYLAKQKLAKLINEKRPFSLTIQTIDTHGPNGFLSKTCQQRKQHNFTDIVACTADQTAEFIDYIIDNGWLDRVNIVVVGDHLARKNPVYKKLRAVKDRSIFNLIISQQKWVKNTDEIVGFDLLPTILTISGFKFDQGKLALGYAAISKPAKNKLPNRIAMMRAHLMEYSPAYNQLWEAQDND